MLGELGMQGSSTRNAFLALLAAVLAGVLLWGCGGGSDSTQSKQGEVAGDGGQASKKKKAIEGSSSVSKEAFLKQANAICAKGKRRGVKEIVAYAKAHRGTGDSKTKLLTKAVTVELLPEIQRQVDEIRSMKAPQGDEEQVEAILTAMEEGVVAASKKPAGPDISTTFKPSVELANNYGLTACAYG